MNLFEQLTFWITVVNEEWNGLFLPTAAVVTLALVVAAHLAVWDRKRRRP